MRVNGIKTESIEIDIDPTDVLSQLIINELGGTGDRRMYKKDDKIYIQETRYFGSGHEDEVTTEFIPKNEKEVWWVDYVLSLHESLKGYTTARKGLNK